MEEEKKKRGRPFGSTGAYKTEKRDRNIGIRVSESELAAIKAKAESEGKNLTQYIIDRILAD